MVFVMRPAVPIVPALLALPLVLAPACKRDPSPQSAPVDPPAAAPSPPGPALDPLERAVGVSRTFPAKYKKRKQERFDLPAAPRVSVRVSVPSGLSREELDANVRHALLVTYDGARPKFGAVDVLAFRGEKVDGFFTAAKGTFAPGGDWGSADPGAPLDRWRTVIEFQESYFAPTPLGVGVSVVMVADEGSTVGLSRSPRSWGDADITARVAPGTAARIVGKQDLGTLVRYEVETAVPPKRRGWVHAYAVKAP